MKKVFIGVLAALMLFAFTACEQQMPTYREVSYITISQTGDFVTDQDFDASKFQVNVYGTDGNVTTLEGNGLVTPVMTTEDPAEWTYEVKATVAGKEAKYTVTPYTIEGWQVNGLPSLEVYKSGSDIVVAATAAGTYTISVNAVYDGGKTMSFGSQKVELKAADLVFDELTIKETSVTVGTVYDVYAGDVKVATATGVAAPTTPEQVFSKYVFTITNPAENQYFGDTYSWRVQAVDAEGEQLSKGGYYSSSTFANNFTVLTKTVGGKAAEDLTIPTTYGAEEVVITAIQTTAGANDRPVITMTFPAGPNYVASVTGFAFADGVTKAQVEGLKIAPSQLKVNFTPADTTDTKLTYDTSKIQIVDQKLDGTNWVAVVRYYYGKGYSEMTLNTELTISTSGLK